MIAIPDYFPNLTENFFSVGRMYTFIGHSWGQKSKHNIFT